MNRYEKVVFYDSETGEEIGVLTREISELGMSVTFYGYGIFHRFLLSKIRLLKSFLKKS